MFNVLLVFSDWGIAFLRAVLGIILIYHGVPKVRALKAAAQEFAQLGFKPGLFWATLVAVLELLGGFFLVLGLFTQIIALLVVLQFLVILFTLKRKSSFREYEFDLLILASAFALLVLGSGAIGLDFVIFR